MRKSLILFLSALLLFSTFPIIQTESASAYVIEPQYEAVQRFSEGLAAVFMKERWGFINKQGDEVIPLSYDYVLPFREGLAAVASDNGWGFIDKTGDMIIEPQFDTIDIQPDHFGGFSEGLAAVSIHDRWGFIDKSGRIVIEPQYDYAFSFSEGLAAVRQDDKWGYINKLGVIVIELIYEEASSFSEGAAAVYFSDGWGFINHAGEAFTGFIYSDPSQFKAGLAPVDTGFIDLEGTLVIDFLEDLYYDSADSFHDGIAVVYKIMQREFYYGYMDRQGKEVVTPQYSVHRQVQFSEGLGAIYEDDLWGFVDRTGKTVIPPQFEDITGDFHEGFVGVLVDDKWGFIDANFPHTAFISTNKELPSSWAVEEVMTAEKLRLIPEHINHHYTTHINRQQFSELVVYLFSAMDGLSVDDWLARLESDLSSDRFEDTNDMMVLAANHLGIVNGRGERKFDPDGEITRQEAAVMLQRSAQKLGITTLPTSIPYTDQTLIANWAHDGVMFVTALKDTTTGYAVMNGVSGDRFDPEGKFTREQAFITMKRLFYAF